MAVPKETRGASSPRYAEGSARSAQQVRCCFCSRRRLIVPLWGRGIMLLCSIFSLCDIAVICFVFLFATALLFFYFSPCDSAFIFLLFLLATAFFTRLPPLRDSAFVFAFFLLATAFFFLTSFATAPFGVYFSSPRQRFFCLLLLSATAFFFCTLPLSRQRQRFLKKTGCFE